MKNSSAYSKLLDLRLNKQIDIVHILSTPRSSSTALERSLFNNSEVDLQINDVWANYRDKDRIRKVYEQILSEIIPHLKKNDKIKILVKSISDYIPPGEEFIRMCNLTSNTIVLVRNPILQIESLLRVMAESIQDSSVIAKNLSIDSYIKDYGYRSWIEMQSAVNKEKKYFEYEQIFKKYFPMEQEAHRMNYMRIPIIKNLRIETVQLLGYKSLEDYAKDLDYSSWNELVDDLKLNSKSIEKHSKVLKSIFECRITGWESMIQHLSTMEEIKHPYFVTDSTLFRLFPHEVMKEISKQIRIHYSESMIDWRGVNKQFNPGDDEGIPYYKKVMDSNKITTPLEAPCELRCFPDFIIHHIINSGGAFDIYLSLLIKIFQQSDTNVISKVVNYNLNGVDFSDIDPILSYCIMKLVKRNDDAKRLRKKHSEFEDVFGIVDSHFRK